MKLNSMILAVSLGLCAFTAGAQTIDKGPDASGYRRFLLYPHLEKGLDVMTRGERIRALAEFEQARVLVPHHPEVVLHLSEMNRRFGEPTRANAVLQPALPVGPVAFRLTSVEKLPAGAASMSKRRSAADSAYEFADQAYKASALGDHTEALRAARQAVHLAPQNRAYRLLLVYELVEIGQLEEADAVAFRAESGDKTAARLEDELAVLHRQVRQRMAFKHFEAASQAAAAGQADAAIESARQGIRYAPEQLANRLQLLSLLLATQKWPEAEQGVSDATGAIGPQPALLVLRAHALQRSGQRLAASADLEAALTGPALSASDQQQFRLIAADAAMAAGEPQKALDLLAPLATGTAAATDEGVLQRRVLALQASRRGTALPAAPTVWSMPKVVCVSKAFSPQCELLPGENSPDAGHAVAEAAYKALEARSHEAAVLKAREAFALSPGNLSYRALLVKALMAGGQLELADQEATGFLATSADDAEMLALRSSVRQRRGQAFIAALDAEAALRSGNLSVVSEIGMLQQLGRRQQARERFAAALREGTFAGQPDREVALLARQVGHEAAVMAAFEQASSVTDSALQNAGYAAGRLGRNEASVDSLK